MSTPTVRAMLVLLLPLGVAADWVAVDMGNPPEGYSQPNASRINDRGQVVGTVLNEDWQDRLFLWDDGDWTILPTLGGWWMHITGFNNRGQVVGIAETDQVGECFEYGDGEIYCENLIRGFVYEDGRIDELGPVGTYSSAGGISDSGSVSGSFETAQGWQFGRWDSAGRFDVMDTQGFGVSPDAINARGQVVGGWACPSWHAFLWTKGEGMTDLGTLGGPTAFATAINDSGVIVGHANTDRVWECETNEWGTFCSYESLAFVWEDGVMTALGSLGGKNTQAAGLNERGVIVGGSDTEEQRCQTWGEYTSCTYIYHAVVWRDGELIDLGTSGQFSAAQDINNRGEIVGFANRRPVIWRPVP